MAACCNHYVDDFGIIQQMNSFRCTESNAAPILDIVWAGLSAGLGVLAAISLSDPSVDPVVQRPIAAVGLSSGVVSGIAAGVGFNKSSRCRAAKRLLAARRARE